MADLGAIGLDISGTLLTDVTIAPARPTPITTRIDGVEKKYLAAWRMFAQQAPTYAATIVAASSTDFLATPTDGYISVNVKENNVNRQGWVVNLIYRETGALVGNNRTDNNGNCVFYGLDPTDSEAYCAIAHDPAGGTEYNALVYDKLTAALVT